MLSKSRIKLIALMGQKKQRDQNGLFLAEGPRMIGDLIGAGLKPEFLVGSDQWTPTKEIQDSKTEIVIIPFDEFKKISLQKTPQHLLGIFPQPKYQLNNSAIKNTLTLALNGIQDPGNLGTIIRMADWFGISDIVCSVDTVDVYNPKVVQASMGALARVRVHYVHLSDFISDYKKNTKNTVYGAFLEGKSIYAQTLHQHALIVMGNEGNGIRPEIEQLIDSKITIPDFSMSGKASESLNVGVATAVICAEFKRQSLSGI
jgi:TrmH family RNA methyltransferase